MNKISTKAIIIKRLDYGEADRIVTFLTPDNGKLSAIAKGAKKSGSKLAGGIEPFSVTTLGIIKGRGDLQTLVSSRLEHHYENIVTDYDRVEVAYEIMKLIDKITEEDEVGEYFELLRDFYEYLDNIQIPIALTATWARLNLLNIYGNMPNLTHDESNQKLLAEKYYKFDQSQGCFVETENGYSADHIKVWRILALNDPQTSKKVNNITQLAEDLLGDLINFTRLQLV